MPAMAESQECCPPFDPAPWDQQTFEWQSKRFIRETVRTFFYVPINFGAVMKRLVGKVVKAQATMPDAICLADHVSRWRMDVYLAVDKEIPNAENTTLSGRFLSKVPAIPAFGSSGTIWPLRLLTLIDDRSTGSFLSPRTSCPMIWYCFPSLMKYP